MSYTAHSSVTSFDKVTDEIHTELTGDYSDATHELHSVSLHDVVDIKRVTRTIKGVKVTKLICVAADGSHVTINAFRA